MECRTGCAACCIAPSISGPLPRHPDGKPPGVACAHLDAALRCTLYAAPGRPRVCASLRPSPEMCGAGRSHALRWLARLEALTAPA